MKTGELLIFIYNLLTDAFLVIIMNMGKKISKQDAGNANSILKFNMQ